MSPSKARDTDHASEKWQIAIYETADGKRPSLEYLASRKVPEAPRRELLLTVVAVAEIGPLEFPTGTKRWRLMHKPTKRGEPDMSGIFEARDQHNRVLYRLFCLLDRGTHSHGPSIVLLDGASKPTRTEMPQRVYRLIASHREEYLSSRRLARLERWPAWWPQPRS